MAALAAATKARWAYILSFSGYPTRNLFTSLGPSSRILRSHKPFSHPKINFPCLSRPFSANPIMGDRIVQELLAEVEREKQLEREERKKKGLEPLDDENEDYMGVGPLIEKLERKKTKDQENIEQFWEPTDSDSDEDDERYSPEELQRNADIFEKKCKRHAELLKNFAEAETFDDAHKWMTKIDKFEDRHLKLPLEYRVIGDMMNRLKESTGKERFILLQKLNRAVKLMEIKEAYDPNNPANFGLIKHQQVVSPDNIADSAGFEKERQMIQGIGLDEDEKDFSESKEQDDTYTEKLNIIEKKLEEKLAQLDHSFGKKGRVLKARKTETRGEREREREREGMAITVPNRVASVRRALAGDITVEEFREWMRRFDVNGDGRISREELRAAIRSVGGHFSGWRSGRWIRQADVDGDGFIDVDDEIDNLIVYAQTSLGLKIVAY